MAQIMEKHGLKLLAWGESGFREVTNSTRPIKSPADLKGLKMRVAGPMFIDVMTDLGANPQQIQWTETFSALQQGVVDGQENPIGAVIVPQRVYEVQKYITTWHYSYDPALLIMSLQKWEALSPEQQALVREMASYISPRPGYTPHTVTMHAADQMRSLVDRADRFQPMQAS